MKKWRINFEIVQDLQNLSGQFEINKNLNLFYDTFNSFNVLRKQIVLRKCRIVQHNLLKQSCDFVWQITTENTWMEAKSSFRTWVFTSIYILAGCFSGFCRVLVTCGAVSNLLPVTERILKIRIRTCSKWASFQEDMSVWSKIVKETFN